MKVNESEAITELETQELKYQSIGTHDVGDIWGTKALGVFVILAERPAKWRGEDIEVYAHIDTWYTIRSATSDEEQLWQAAVDAASARRALRSQLGATRSYQFDAATHRLVTTMRALDSYDDRWTPPAPIDLDDSAMAIEQEYVTALARLHGHA